MTEDKLLKKLNSAFGVVVENHVVVKIDVGRSVRPDLDASVIGVSLYLEVRPLFDRGNLYSYTRYRKNGTPDEICQVGLQVEGYGAPLV